MKTWLQYAAALAGVAGLTTLALAQLPGGGAPAVGAPAPATPATPAAATAPGGVPQGFPFCEKLEATCDKCKRKLCATVFGQMLNNMTKPMTMFTGGLIPPCCPETPSAQELADAANDPGPLGAAAVIAADEANAKKRRAAVRYLGTADCHWWPEAEKALIVALRTDRNECVRMEAACALGNGCCCTRKTIAALAITVEGSEKDGNPSENSERVRVIALRALNHCLCCYRQVTPLTAPAAPEEKRVGAAAPAKSAREMLETKSKIVLPPYYVELEKKNLYDIVVHARKAAESNPVPDSSLVTGNQTLLNVLDLPLNFNSKKMTINGGGDEIVNATTMPGSEPPALQAAVQNDSVIMPVPAASPVVMPVPVPAPAAPVQPVSYQPLPAVAPAPVVVVPAPMPVAAPVPMTSAAPAPAPVAAPAPVVVVAPAPAPVAESVPVVTQAPVALPEPAVVGTPVVIMEETPAPVSEPVPATALMNESQTVPAPTSEVTKTENVPLDDLMNQTPAVQAAQGVAPAPANKPKSAGLISIFRRNDAPEAAKRLAEVAPVQTAPAKPNQYQPSWFSAAPKAESKPAAAAPAQNAYRRTHTSPANDAAVMANAMEVATSDPAPGTVSWAHGGARPTVAKETPASDANTAGYRSFSRPTAPVAPPVNTANADGYHSFGRPDAAAAAPTAPVPTDPLAPGSAPYRRSWSQ